jgi:hypothetical protein
MSGRIKSNAFDIRAFSSDATTFVAPYWDRFWCETDAVVDTRDARWMTLIEAISYSGRMDVSGRRRLGDTWFSTKG